MLGTGLIATLSATVFINGIAFLIPALNDVRGINLAEAALLSAMCFFDRLSRSSYSWNHHK